MHHTKSAIFVSNRACFFSTTRVYSVHMFAEFWNVFLYQPLFNGLIWLYNTWADGNMGWAIVYLTILLRVALLPLTIVGEYNDRKNQDLHIQVQKLAKEFHYDAVQQKEEIRRMLRKRRVKPWAKTVSLGIQGLVLVLLYQVFLGGITGERMMKTLYPIVDFPGAINNNFYGFDLAMQHNVFWAAIVAVWLAAEIYIEFRAKKHMLDRPDLFYFVLLPLAVFFFLWILPMAKSLFILTSIIFSAIVHVSLKPFFSKKDQTPA